jgi:outer membrane protein
LLLKKTVVLLALALMILNFSAVVADAASDKIGFIDPQRVLEAHSKYEASQKQIDEFIKKKTEEARTAAEKETDAEKRMQIIETARMESGQEDLKVMKPILDDINKVIESVAKAKGVTIVIERVFVFYGGVDLTDDVVKGIKAIK